MAKSMSGRQANPPARPVGDGYMAREGHRSLAGRHEHEFDSLPGRIAGWVCECGHRLVDDKVLECNACGRRYRQSHSGLVAIGPRGFAAPVRLE